MTKRPVARKFRMTRKRADYVENRDKVIKGDELRLNAEFQRKRAEMAEKMVDRMAKDVDKHVEKLFKSTEAKETFAMDASLSGMAKSLMSRLSTEWERRFNLFAKEFCVETISMVDRYAAKDLGASLERLSGGVTIKTDSLGPRVTNVIRAATEESTSLIKSIRSDYMDEVREAVQRSIVSGTGNLSDTQKAIHKMLTTRYRKYRNKAKNLVLDQTRKTYQGINQTRMRDIGQTQFEWVHMGGSQKPRAYHKDVLNGKIYDLNDPPVIDPSTGEKGLPGTAINCKCIMRPVIRFNNAS